MQDGWQGDFLNMDTLTCVFQTHHPDFQEVHLLRSCCILITVAEDP